MGYGENSTLTVEIPPSNTIILQSIVFAPFHRKTKFFFNGLIKQILMSIMLNVKPHVQWLTPSLRILNSAEF